MTTYNANRPHGFGLIDPAHFVPFPKNPVLAAFFREIDRADELGSGMRKMMLYGKKYGGADPQLIEGDVFRMVISVPEFEQNGTRMGPRRDPDGTQIGPRWDPDGGMSGAYQSTNIEPTAEQYLNDTQLHILRFCLQEQGINALLECVERTNRTKFRRQILTPCLNKACWSVPFPTVPPSKNQKYRTTEQGKK